MVYSFQPQTMDDVLPTSYDYRFIV